MPCWKRLITVVTDGERCIVFRLFLLLLSSLMPHHLLFLPPYQYMSSDCCVFGQGTRSLASCAQGGWGPEDGVETLIRSHLPDSTVVTAPTGRRFGGRHHRCCCARKNGVSGSRLGRSTCHHQEVYRHGASRVASGRIFGFNHGKHWAVSSSLGDWYREEIGPFKTDVAGVTAGPSYAPLCFSSSPFFDLFQSTGIRPPLLVVAVALSATFTQSWIRGATAWPLHATLPICESWVIVGSHHGTDCSVPSLSGNEVA